jgi:hypothetical protein
MLYHGSYRAVEKPELKYCRERTDFGQGFYVTPLKEQAAGWARRFARERGSGGVTSFAFLSNPGEKLPPDVKILEFDTHSLDWLNFVTACRLGRPVGEWDLVIGGVANDKVFDTIQLYFENLVGAEEAIGRLRYNKPNFQYCFRTQSLIDNYLNFISYEGIV